MSANYKRYFRLLLSSIFRIWDENLNHCSEMSIFKVNFVTTRLYRCCRFKYDLNRYSLGKFSSKIENKKIFLAWHEPFLAFGCLRLFHFNLTAMSSFRAHEANSITF